MNNLYIAIDLGAESIRVSIGLHDRIIETISHTNIPVNDDHYGLIWNINKIYCDVISSLNLLINKYFNPHNVIHSISITSWGLDYISFDNEDVVYPCFHYRNKRYLNGIYKIKNNYDLYKLTGSQRLEFNTLVQLLSADAIKSNKSIERHTFSFVADAISCMITRHTTLVCDLSIASTSQLLDINTLEWNQLYDNYCLPQIIKPGYVFGSHANIPIISTLSHDTACAVHYTTQLASASNIDTDSYVYVILGTWCIVGTINNKPVTSKDAYYKNVSNEVGYQMNYKNTDIDKCDKYYRILKNCSGLWLLQQYYQHLNMTNNISYEEFYKLSYSRIGCPYKFINLTDQLYMTTSAELSYIFDNISDPGKFIHDVTSSLTHLILKCINDIEFVMKKKYLNLIVVGGGYNKTILSTLKLTRNIIVGSTQSTTLGNLHMQHALNVNTSRDTIGNIA